ncbi:unnamed protein product, partial [Nesidiocoris tenuis]
MEEKSIGGSNYFLTIVDDFTRYTQVYFLCSKDEVYDRISEFITQAERETGLKLKAIRSDNGTEFVNQRVEKLLKSKGIKHQRSVVMVPQQNGVVERAQRFIAERARCTLADAGLPKCYWAEAVSTAVYLNNRSPTKSVKNMMPIEAWTGKLLSGPVEGGNHLLAKDLSRLTGAVCRLADLRVDHMEYAYLKALALFLP